jgi:L-seryl-tRNA(Ser) seleniumtransferase
VVADVGSGLLHPDSLLPAEPDVTSALRAGATLVTCSGDKLLGGPQAGLILGAKTAVAQVRRHPLARAVRVDKTTLAALEATLRGPKTPAWQGIRADAVLLRQRAERLAAAVGGEVVPSDGAVGGGGAPGVVLPGWAVALPPSYAEALRRGTPCVVGRVERDRCLLDLRCVPEQDDERLRDAVLACTGD